jgi:hypothetical protein
MGKALKIRDDLSAEAMRRVARREKDGRAAARMYAIANALEGMSRAEAARLAGMERQALRDAAQVPLRLPMGREGRLIDSSVLLSMAMLEGSAQSDLCCFRSRPDQQV